MDHQDIAARLARRFTDSNKEEALRISSEQEARDTVRTRVAAGAFEGALLELAHSSSGRHTDYDDMADDIRMLLEEELEAAAKRIAHLVATRMDRPMPSGEGNTLRNGTTEDTYDGEKYTSWEITPPDKIVFRKAIRSKVTKLVVEFLKNRHVTNMKLQKDAIVAFFRSPAVQQWMGQKWVSIVGDAAEMIKSPLSLYNLADEAAYDNTEEEISCTIYKEDDDEEVPCGYIQYTIHLDEPVWRVLKAEVSGGNLVLGLEASFKTRGPYKVDLS